MNTTSAVKGQFFMLCSYLLLAFHSGDAQQLVESHYGPYKVVIKEATYKVEETTEYSYHLVNILIGDTTYTSSSFRNSYPRSPPSFSQDGKYLILENSYGPDVPPQILQHDDWYEKSTIIIWNLETYEIKDQFPGFLMTQSDHFNEAENVLIYYRAGGNSRSLRIAVMKYDLNTFSSVRLHQLPCASEHSFPSFIFLEPGQGIWLANDCWSAGDPQNDSEGVELKY